MTHQQTILRYNRVPFHTTEGEDVLQRVEKHWEKMRDAKQIPTRTALAPEPLDEALSHCFILERVAPELARFRVAGRDLTKVLGMEARSMPLNALFTVNGREALGPMIENVVSGPHVVEMPLTSSRGLARAPVKARLLMMPLADRNGEPTRIFGALVTDRKPNGTAWRFDVDTAQPLRCKRVFANLRKPVVHGPSQPFPVSAPAPTAANPATLPKSGRPHLRLVVDNSAQDALT